MALRSALLAEGGTPLTSFTVPEGAWLRHKGDEAIRQAWADDGVDVLDP
jgi:hypothetical protein